MDDGAAAAGASDSVDDDEEITKFISFTGASDVSKARSYLEMSGGDLQTAVALYLEHSAGGGAGPGPGPGAGAAPGGSGGSGGMAASAGMGAGLSGGGGGDDDVRAPDRTRTMRLMDFDNAGGGAAMAAAMAAGGMLGPHGMGMGMGMGMGGAGPGGDAVGGTGGMGAAMMSAFAEDIPTASAAGAAAGSAAAAGAGAAAAEAGVPFDAREAVNRASAAAASGSTGAEGGGDDDAWDAANSEDGASDGDGGGTSSSSTNRGGTGSSGGRASSLADMFAPPTHLIYSAPGGFQGARQAARDSRRWLLVNLQSDSDFACHALNRDVWRDELVENLVRDGFIFWQAIDATADGRTYVSRYPVGGYPHVSIIDPRTGRLMWKKEGWTQVNPMTPVQFAEIAADFCSRHSFDKPPSAPRASSGPGMSSAAASGSRGSSNKRPIAEMTEEEQLEAAIRASMADAEDGSGADDGNESVGFASMDGDADGDYDMVSDTEAVKKETTTQNEVSSGKNEEGSDSKDTHSKSFEEELLATEVGQEPTSGNIARVQIRMPDGKRLVRKFCGDDSVKVIFAFVAQQANDAIEQGKQLELKAGFPPRDLLDEVESSISSCGLAGESITSRWK